jgi:hypothetical protein
MGAINAIANAKPSNAYGAATLEMIAIFLRAGDLFGRHPPARLCDFALATAKAAESEHRRAIASTPGELQLRQWIFQNLAKPPSAGQ